MGEPACTTATRIERVTVYRVGAEVRRIAEIESPSTYPAEIIIPGLPLQLRDDTLQLAVEPLGELPADACPLAVDVQLALEPPPGDPSLPPPSDAELQAADRRVRICHRALERARGQLAAVGELGLPDRPEPAEGEPPLPSPTQARMALLAFQRDEQDRLAELVADAKDAHRRAREDQAALKARKDRQQTRRQLRPHELRKQARVTLQAPHRAAPEGGRVRLAVSYLVPAARWAPAYTMRIDAKGGRAELALRASICQRSDEDWTGVQLVLSTADAMRWAELPELGALRYGRAQPAPRAKGWRPPPVGVEALFEGWHQGRELLPRGGAARQPAPTPPPPPRAEPPPMPVAAMAAAPEPECEAVMDDLVEEQRRPVLHRAKAKRRGRPPAPRAASGLSFASAGAPPAAQSISEPNNAPSPGGYGGPPEPPPPLDAGRDLLDYDALRMAAPEQGSLGRLEPIDAHQRYLELMDLDTRPHLPSARELGQHVREASNTVRTRPLAAGMIAPASTDAYDHAWRGEQPVDVPSDGRFHTVPVQITSAPASVRYVAVPRETQDVFRTVRLDNTGRAPLLPGPVDVYLDGDYLLAGAVSSTPSGGTLELGLGVEQGVRVSRNTRYAEHQRGMVSRHLDLQHELRFELRNLLEHRARIELRERIPVQREDDDDVEIELREVEPPWEPWDQERSPLHGAYRWLLELEPGQVRHLRASYVITIASKHELAGGNRRED